VGNLIRRCNPTNIVLEVADNGSGIASMYHPEWLIQVMDRHDWKELSERPVIEQGLEDRKIAEY
jgi:hypothetical protein